jgi:type II secretory ATPase GspE/PulE/Tfp pilus assembly ATPase PilB-like protein
MLDQLNQPDINIITLEDPVELSLPGVSQTQVSHKKGLDFSAGLRSIVRQDPDVIMVGEVRDLETARISIQSALTGHLVLSTLHTNDALSAITRLIDIGVDPSMINASLIGVVAQRLVRTLCSECKTVHPNPDEHLRSLGFDPAERKGKPLFLEGACENCQNKGFNGRTAIYEILVLGDEMKATLQDQPSLQELKTISRQQGFVTMADDGLEKVRLGLTTADEVFRVTQVRGF